MRRLRDLAQRRGGLVPRFALLVAFVLSCGLAVVIAAEEPAQAWDIECDLTADFAERVPSSSQYSLTGLFQGSSRDRPVSRQTEMWDTSKGRPIDKVTLYEAMGMNGTQWSYTEWLRQEGFEQEGGGGSSDPEKVCNPMAPAMTSLANQIFSWSKTITAFTISIRGLASNPEPFVSLLEDTGKTVETLRTGLYISGAAIALMITGIMCTAKALRGDATTVRRDVMWALGCLLVGSLLIVPVAGQVPNTKDPDLMDPNDPGGDSSMITVTHPRYYWLTTNAVELGDEINSALASVVLPSETAENDICSASGKDAARRILDCQIYKVLVYEPWAAGQFGSSSPPLAYTVDDEHPGLTDAHVKGSDLRLIQMWAQGRTADEDNRQLGKLEPRSLGGTTETEFGWGTHYGTWNQVRQQMYENYPSDYMLWKGDQYGERLAIASTAFVTSLLVAALVLVTSLLLLLWNVVTIALFYALPIVATLAIVPPLQHLAKQWFTTWWKAIMLIGVFQLVQTFALMLVSTTMRLDYGVGIKALIAALLLAALWKLMKAASGSNFGANSGGNSVFDPKAIAGAAQESASDVSGTSRAVKEKVTRSRVAKTASAATVAAIAGGGQNRKDLSQATKDHKRKQTTKTSRLAEQQRGFLTDKGRPMTDAELTAADEKLTKELGLEDGAPTKASLGQKGVLGRIASGGIAGLTSSRVETGAGAGTVAVERQRKKAQERSANHANQQAGERDRQQAAYRREQAEHSQWVAAGRPEQEDGRPARWVAPDGQERPPQPPTVTPPERITFSDDEVNRAGEAARRRAAEKRRQTMEAASGQAVTAHREVGLWERQLAEAQAKGRDTAVLAKGLQAAQQKQQSAEVEVQRQRMLQK